jgi:hypothetical protein
MYKIDLIKYVEEHHPCNEVVTCDIHEYYNGNPTYLKVVDVTEIGGKTILLTETPKTIKNE